MAPACLCLGPPLMSPEGKYVQIAKAPCELSVLINVRSDPGRPFSFKCRRGNKSIQKLEGKKLALVSVGGSL